MRKVSEELLALRTESNRVLHEELTRGEALSSQADMGTAQELDAQTLLMQSQLDYTQANDRSCTQWAGHPSKGILTSTASRVKVAANTIWDVGYRSRPKGW